MSAPPLANATTCAPLALAVSRKDGKIRHPREWMLGHAQHLAARRLHGGGGIPRQRHAECIVGRDIEPGLEAGLGQRRRRRVREHPTVVGPVHHVRRARLAGQVRRHRAGVQMHLVLLGAEIVQRQRDGAVVDLQHRVHVAAVEPFPHDVERDVGVVLVIAHQILHRHALGRRIEILDRLARAGNRHCARVRAVRPGDIRQMPDLERPGRPRRADHPRRRQARDTPCCRRQYIRVATGAFPWSFGLSPSMKFPAARPRPPAYLIVANASTCNNRSGLDDCGAYHRAPRRRWAKQRALSRAHPAFSLPWPADAALNTMRFVYGRVKPTRTPADLDAAPKPSDASAVEEGYQQAGQRHSTWRERSGHHSRALISVRIPESDIISGAALPLPHQTTGSSVTSPMAGSRSTERRQIKGVS